MINPRNDSTLLQPLLNSELLDDEQDFAADEKEYKQESQTTEEGELVYSEQNTDPSAPLPELAPEKVTYLEPDYLSFDEMKPNSWMRKPETQLSFTEFDAKNTDWIRSPNANSEAELLRAINGTIPAQTGRAAAVGASVFFSTIFTGGIYAYKSTKNIAAGEIAFSDNAGQQHIATTPGLHYLANPRHSWVKTRKSSENFIREGNITIVRILPGHIGLATDNGHPIVLLPGRHAYNSNLFKLEETDIHKMSHPLIQFKTIAIIRIMGNELGFADMNSQQIILLPGLHILNSPAFQYRSKLNTKNFKTSDEVPDQKYPTPKEAFEFGTISVVRLQNNQIGCATIGRESVLLRPGIHIKNNAVFKYEKSVEANLAHLEFNTIHVIQVKPGEIGLAWHNNKPIKLKPGNYEYNTPIFKFVNFVNANEKLIQHGTYTYVRVDTGELGYVRKKQNTEELQPGEYQYDDSQIRFLNFHPADKGVIKYGNNVRIIVKSGEARAIWKDGKLEVLKAGKYEFASATLSIADSPIPLQNKILHLHEITVATQDRMPMHVTGQVTYSVKDPEKLIIGLVGEEKEKANIQVILQQMLEATATANLRHHISLTDLSIIKPDHHHKASDQKNEGPAQSAALKLYGDQSHSEGDNYRGQLSTQVQQHLSNVAQQWGIEIVEFAISDIGYQDKEVEKSLATATANTRKAEADYDLQVAQNATAKIKAEGLAQQHTIQERNAAEILKIKNESNVAAELHKVKQEAEAKAEAKKIEANGELERAEAEKNSALLRAEGQKALAEAQLVLLNNPNYVSLELARLQVEMARHLATMQTPAVVFNGNTQAAESMLFGSGTSLLEFAMKGRSFFPAAKPPTPAVQNVVADPQVVKVSDLKRS